MRTRFRNRLQAGKVLARHLASYAARPDVVVLALPRGGVPVAFEVARALNAPLGIFTVRKLGVPGHEELAMGALAADGTRMIDWDAVAGFKVSEEQLEAVIGAEERELARRERRYRGDAPRIAVEGRTVILVDDGLATGSTMRTAIAAVRIQRPAHVVVGVPVAEPIACETLEAYADDVVCAYTPEPFLAVSFWYEDFAQTSDEEVTELLRLAARDHDGSEFSAASTLPA